MLKTLLAAGSAAALIVSANANPLTEAPAGAYEIDGNHAYIAFSYDHQGYSRPVLRVTKFDSSINLDPADPANSTVVTTIDVANIDSGVEVFDGHLQGENFFNAAAFPTITFESTGIKITGDNTAKITGDLTIKGETKPVVLDAKFRKLGETRDGRSKLGFGATTTIKRSDFGVDQYVPYVGDEVSITIETEYEQAK